MAQLVAAHVTLVHQAEDPADFLERLKRIAATTPPIEISLTHAACWGSPAGGIYVAVEDSLGALAELRRSLLVTDPPGVAYTPHVTLLHPRTATPARARAAWTLLHDMRVDQAVTIDEVTLVQKRRQRWELTNRIRLKG
jgi:2'-5' RNA ligase